VVLPENRKDFQISQAGLPKNGFLLQAGLRPRKAGDCHPARCPSMRLLFALQERKVQPAGARRYRGCGPAGVLAPAVADRRFHLQHRPGSAVAGQPEPGQWAVHVRSARRRLMLRAGLQAGSWPVSELHLAASCCSGCGQGKGGRRVQPSAVISRSEHLAQPTPSGKDWERSRRKAGGPRGHPTGLRSSLARGQRAASAGRLSGLGGSSGSLMWQSARGPRTRLSAARGIAQLERCGRRQPRP